MTRTPPRLRPKLLVAFAITAEAVFAASAQPPASPPAGNQGGQSKGQAADRNTHQAQLISVRDDGGRIVYRVIRDGSQRVYNLPVADGVRVRANGDDLDLTSLPPATLITVTTGKRDGVDRVVGITAGRPGDDTPPPGPVDRPGDPTGGKVSMAFPTGDKGSSVLLVESNAPDQVRVGEPFDYQVKVTNISKNLMLENVIVRQIASVQLDVSGDAGNAQSAGGQAAQGGKGGRSADRRAAGSASDRTVRWTVPTLAPGESATLRAPAVAHAEGTVGSCFRVSYEPSVCVRLKAVQPNLTLTKSAPQDVRFCDGFKFKYTVKNTGSAVAQGVVVTDDLPDGLASDQKNQRQARFDVGDLKPGESKELNVAVLAAGRGKFTSKATAATTGGLRVQSRPTTTRVREADLTVDVSGPDTSYVQEGATYTVRVKNDGDAPAPGSRLEVQLDPKVRFAHAGQLTHPGADADPQKGGNPQKAGGQQKGGNAAPTPDKNGKLTWDLGTLQPGEVRETTVTVTGQQQGTARLVAVARFTCARAKDNQDLAVAREAVKTELLVVPALRLSLVDQNDLVKVGDMVTYTVRVTNQGTGPDSDVSVKLALPPQLQYVDSNGPNQAAAQGQAVTFPAVQQLAPGQTLTWNIRAKAVQAGDVRTTAELHSGYLKNPVTTTEPTRLIK